jgi:phosphoserine phosphatase
MAKYKIVIFDIDGTIFTKPWRSPNEKVSVSSWNVVYKELGIFDIHEKLKNMFIEKRFKSYMDWNYAGCCVLQARGLNKKTFDKIIQSRPYNPGVKETFKILAQNKIITGVVSGSFEALALRLQKEIGVNHALAHCRLEFDKKTGLLKDWQLFGTDWQDKIKFVKYVATLYKTRLENVAYVGDDVNDIPVFKKVGLAIAFNAEKKEVKEAAHVVIKKRDLREILPYLGLKFKSNKA